MTGPHDAPIVDGDQMTTAVIGVPVAGVVQLWTDAPSLWRVQEFDQFAGLVGTGQVARTEIAPRRYREVALLDEKAGTLVLLQRTPAIDGDTSSVPGAVFTLEPADAFESDSFRDNVWEQFNSAVTDVATDAFSRAEIAVIERGGWDDTDDEYCLAAALLHDGEPVVVIETAPTPTGNDYWPSSDDSEGQTVTAPLTDEALPGIGVLTMAAVHGWGIAPWDVAVTYIVPDPDDIESGPDQA